MASNVMARIGFATEQPKQNVYIFHYFHSKMRFKCHYNGGTAVYDLEPNACILIDKNTYFSIYSILDHPVSYAWMMVDCSPEEIAKFGIEFGRAYYPTQYDRLSRALSELDRIFLYRYGSEQYALDSDRLVRQILELTTSTEEAPKISSEHLEMKLYALREMMIENPGDKWTVPVMAKTVNLSLSYFATLYKSIYGAAPVDDLISIKIENAKKRILAGETLTDISDSLGYANYTHFSRQFKKIEGIPPIQWKKQHKQKKQRSLPPTH